MAYYLSTLPYAEETCRRLAVEVDGDRAHSNGPAVERDVKDELIFSPSRGSHVFWHNKWPYWLSREVEESKGDNATALQKEYFVLNTYGRDSGRVKRMIESAYKTFKDRTRTGLDVRISSSWGWNDLKEGRKRSMDTVYLVEGQAEAILSQIQEFIDQKEVYDKRGRPHKTGLLFYGPPGTGKSSTVRAIATEFDMGLYIVNLKSAGMEDTDLIERLQEVSPGSIVLFEDVDCVTPTRDGDNKGVTLAGLLNAVDGVASPQNVVFIFSTNNRDALDPALLRAGRIDGEFYMGPATANQIYRIVKNADPLFTLKEIESIFGSQTVLPCDVQNALGVDSDVSHEEYVRRLTLLANKKYETTR